MHLIGDLTYLCFYRHGKRRPVSTVLSSTSSHLMPSVQMRMPTLYQQMEVNKVKSTFHETTLINLLQVMVARSHKHRTLSQVFLVLSRMHNPKKMTSARSQMKLKKRVRPLMLLAPTLMLPNLLNQHLLPK